MRKRYNHAKLLQHKISMPSRSGKFAHTMSHKQLIDLFWVDLQRAERIQRNSALIQQLQLKQLMHDLASSIQPSSAKSNPKTQGLVRQKACKNIAANDGQPARRFTRQRIGPSEEAELWPQTEKNILNNDKGISHIRLPLAFISWQK